MLIKFKVHNLTKISVPTKATVNGEEMDVQAHGMRVELVEETGRHGSFTMNFVGPEQMQEANKLFEVDDIVEATFE